MILAGDIGGTNTRLGIFETVEGELKTIVGKTFPSREHKSLDEIVALFLSEHALTIEKACFAVAGPVHEGRVATTNLAWIVDAGQLANLLGLGKVDLINDLEAIAYSLPELRESDFVVLNKGTGFTVGNQGIIAAGTGLGEAGTYWDGVQNHPFACEGGHTDFGPRNQLEYELLGYLQAKYDRVSYERVLSGSGLFEIYKFLRDTGRGQEPGWLAKEIKDQVSPAVIVRAALEKKTDLCVQSVDLFVSLYGAEAGNLALKIMARGGVFLGGGIAPRIVQKLKETPFMEGFTGKGRMKPLLEAMPVRVIMNDKAGLLGAARYTTL